MSVVLETNFSEGVQSPEQTVQDQLEQLRPLRPRGTVGVLNAGIMWGFAHIIYLGCYGTYSVFNCVMHGLMCMQQTLIM